MIFFRLLLALLVSVAASSLSLGFNALHPLKKLVHKTVGILISSSLIAANVNAIDANEQLPVYFGVGCFWHVQHEFAETEKNILNRNELDVTSRAGYAGGTSYGDIKVNKDNFANGNRQVCYHNLLGTSDYGSLGHGEVVGLKIPADTLKEFATEYFSLYGSDNERPDKGDRGPEYRSLLGLPGGVNSKYYKIIKDAADKKGVMLKEGSGNDPDTLGKKMAFVMDSTKFPFNQAEVYHQFHDGFMPGEQYPQSYNSISNKLLVAGQLKYTGCPE